MELLKGILNILAALFAKSSKASAPNNTQLTAKKQPENTQLDWTDLDAKISKYFTVKEAIWLRSWNELGEPKEITKQNILDLAVKMDKLREAFNKPLRVTSWYRPLSYNAHIGGSKASKHISGKAVDIHDTNGELAVWCVSNLGILKEIGLYIEDPRYTIIPNKGKWVHFQSVPPKSGSRIFIPYAAKPPNPGFWDGKYDKSKFD